MGGRRCGLEWQGGYLSYDGLKARALPSSSTLIFFLQITPNLTELTASHVPCVPQTAPSPPQRPPDRSLPPLSALRTVCSIFFLFFLFLPPFFLSNSWRPGPSFKAKASSSPDPLPHP